METQVKDISFSVNLNNGIRDANDRLHKENDALKAELKTMADGLKQATLDIEKLKDKEIDLTLTLQHQLNELQKLAELRTKNVRLRKAVDDLSEDVQRLEKMETKHCKKIHKINTMDDNNKENKNKSCNK